MAKRKKTLKQKIAADMHHQVYSFNNTSSVSLVSKKEKINFQPESVTTTSYLKHDILKTTFLTGAILLFQTILFLMLKNHAIKIPNISY